MRAWVDAQNKVLGRLADEMRAILSSGAHLALFPEGTTEGGHVVLPFRPSLFSSLFPPLPGVKVQPAGADIRSTLV